MDFNRFELVETRRQIDSTLNKLKQTVKTLEAKEIRDNCKSQIKRRIEAFEISVALIEREMANLDEYPDKK